MDSCAPEGLIIKVLFGRGEKRGGGARPSGPSLTIGIGPTNLGAQVSGLFGTLAGQDQEMALATQPTGTGNPEAN